MEKVVLNMVQAQIGYRFNNNFLLKQAFVRRSYTKENGGKDNEVLEFIGDKVLDLAVVCLLVKRYGHLGSNNASEFACDCDEGDRKSVV